jgi:DNA-binding MarR family transcriptional regulator
MDDQADIAQRYERVGDSMRDFYLRSHRLMDRIMTTKGASFARAKLLIHIARSGTPRSIDLAAMMGFAPRTITEAIDGLERDGLVRRDPDPEDRRAKLISLTPAGIEAVEAADASRKEYIGDVFSVLDMAECDEIVRLMGKLNDRLAALGG